MDGFTPKFNGEIEDFDSRTVLISNGELEDYWIENFNYWH